MKFLFFGLGFTGFLLSWLICIKIIHIIFGQSLDYSSMTSSNSSNDVIKDQLDDDSSPEKCEPYKFLTKISYGKRGDICCPRDHYVEKTCFTNKLGSLWQHLTELPDCAAKIKPEFFVYTPEAVKENSDMDSDSKNQTIDYLSLNESVLSLNISKNRPFFVIIHGFNTKSWNKNWMHAMKDALLELEYNVMIVKWTAGSNTMNYIKAAANTRSVGGAMVAVIQTLVLHRKIDLSSATLIGFSLGAHMAGYVGSKINGLPRIIGLDPAGPFFACEHPDVRLDPTDAHFVQVIHTNGNSILKGGLGAGVRLGHVDFYANGGHKQPGCNGSVFKHVANMIKNFKSNGFKHLSCSHASAPWLFIEMIKRHMNNLISGSNSNNTSCRFTSFPCPSYENWKMGGCFRPTCSSKYESCLEPGLMLRKEDIKKYGKYFFNTFSYNDTIREFCGRQYLLTLTVSSSAKGRIFVSFGTTENATTEEIKFQKSYNSIDDTKSRVVVLPWDSKRVRTIRVLYTRYKSRIFKNGPAVFLLSNVTLEAYEGHKHCHNKPILIESKKPIDLDLSDC